MMMMRASPIIQAPKIGILQREVFPITRTRICYPRQLTWYPESLLKEHGDILVDVIENFPNTPAKETPKLASPTSLSPSLKKLKATARVGEIGSDGKLPPHILYLLELCMNLDQIKSITHRFPAFANYTLEGKIKPVVEFLLDLGVNKSDIPTILCKRPQLCGTSLSENLIPMMAYFESLGVDKKKWAKVIYQFPSLLSLSRQKVKATVDFFYELGLAAESVGKVLTRYPQIFGLSIEGKLKPVNEFFLEKGYSMEDVATMVSRSGVLYTYSLVDSIIPKWEFFLTMNYSMSDLVKFPQYFGYSLEERIKPRYAQVSESGLKLSLSQVLIVAEPKLEKFLKRSMKKKFDDLGLNMKELNANF